MGRQASRITASPPGTARVGFGTQRDGHRQKWKRMRYTRFTEPSVCRHAIFNVLRAPRAVPDARAFCRETLTLWDLSALISDTLVVVSELVTNGLLHAGTPLTVTVSGASGHVEIAVADGNPTPPTIRPHRVDLPADLDAIPVLPTNPDLPHDRDVLWHVGDAGPVVGGRGLLLVEALTAKWGVTPTSTGKAVWAELPIPAGWQHGVDCPCGATGPIRLASGRTATDRTAA